MNWDISVCYKYHATTRTKDEAVDVCLAEGAEGLLRIDTTVVLNFFLLPEFFTGMYILF